MLLAKLIFWNLVNEKFTSDSLIGGHCLHQKFSNCTNYLICFKMLMKINVVGIRREEKLQHLVTYPLKTISFYVKS